MINFADEVFRRNGAKPAQIIPLVESDCRIGTNKNCEKTIVQISLVGENSARLMAVRRASFLPKIVSI